MSVATENRQVSRQVKVYRCDRCRAETTEDAINGWWILVTVEMQPQPTVFGTMVPQMTAKPGAGKHACPSCGRLVDGLMGEPAPTMVDNDIANIPIRRDDGEITMLTRFEYDRWVARGKPPILSEADVKVKS